jgi:hypothetical protein
MYKKEIKTEKFPCDFCKNICPLSGDDCPAKVDLKGFFKSVDPERIYEAYQCYLNTVGLGVIKRNS